MIGSTISHYKILEKLGEGGMGVVYKAQDLTLDRPVALKFLPPQAVSDEAEHARFLQEARAASAINHPHVCTIYAVEEHRGEKFIAMEFVDGQTLRRKFETAPLNIGVGLDYAIQICEALQEAHNRGIVHRDIKSENIMVNSKNQVKVMDFGLAKLKGSLKLTRTSSTIGTLAYMSPEQIQGGEADARSDIFSFGVVWYEMLTRHLPFRGEHEAAIVYSIVNEEPEPIQKYRPEASSELAHIINKTLEKDPEDRYQTVTDLLVDLRRVKKQTTKLTQKWTGIAAAPASPKPAEILSPVERPKGSEKKIWIGLGVLGALAVALVSYWLYISQIRTKEAVPLQLSFTQLTDQAGVEIFPDFSPDGNFIAYTSSLSGNADIYLQRVGGVNPINLTKDTKEDDTQPAFSPDGSLIAFCSERQGGGIFVMGATGESVRRLTDFGYNPAWSPDGQQIVCATERIDHPLARNITSQLWTVNAKTGEKRLLFTGDAVQPHWSPHGHRIAYWGLGRGTTGSGQRDLSSIPAVGGEPTAITNDIHVDWNPVWSPDGRYLYFSSDRGGSMNLWRVQIDEQTGKVLGEPEPITTPARWSGQLKVSHDGRHIVYSALDQRANIYKVAFDLSKEMAVGSPVPVTQGTRQFANPDISPDGEWIVFKTSGQQEDLFLIRSDGTGLRQLTDDIYKDRGPSWSPDGKRIAFYSNRAGRYDIWAINPDGSGLEQLTKTSGESPWFPSWLPDGMRIAFVNNSGTFIVDLSKPLEERTPQPLPPPRPSGENFYMTSLGPNGQRMAGHRRRLDGSEIPGVLVYSLETQKYEVVADSGLNPVWLHDNRRLLFEKDARLCILDSQTKRFHEILTPPANTTITDFRISRDDRTIYLVLSSSESDLWQVTMK